MALDPSRLSNAIYTRWVDDPRSGLCNPLSAAQQSMLRSLCDAVAIKLVNELTGHAQVNVPSTGVTVASVTGVLTGGGVSGPGSGTTAATLATIS